MDTADVVQSKHIVDNSLVIFSFFFFEWCFLPSSLFHLFLVCATSKAIHSYTHPHIRANARN